MKTKNICLLSLFAYPLFNKNSHGSFGGAEVQLYQIAKKLSKLPGYNINFIVGNFGQRPMENYQKIKVIRCGPKITSNGVFAKGIFPIGLLFTLIRVKPNVLIQRAAGVETGLLALYCRLLKIKFIYMTASSIDTDRGYRRMKPLYGVFYEFGLKHATNIICQNYQQQEQLEKNYCLKSVVIKNSFSIPSNAIYRKKDILWVGTSQPLKQPEIFLNLAKLFPQYTFVMIIPKHNVKLWTSVYQQSKTISNLKFVEKISFNKIHKYYARARLFINTSTLEGFPNTFIQAAMYSTPIISLNVNPDNFLNNHCCGFSANGNYSLLKKYVLQLCTDRSLWRAMSQNAYRYAQENHDIDKNIKKIIQVIND